MVRKIILPAIAGLLVALAGYMIFSPESLTGGSEEVATTTSQPLMAASAQEAGAADVGEEADATEIVVDEMVLGDPDAPVTIIEYASHTCPHCARFHDEVYPELETNYIETGQVQFILREVYFDRYGLWAGMVARCGGPVRYFGIVDLIMENQREWTQGEPQDIAANLRRLGRSAGLTDDMLDACLTDNAMAEALIATSTANAEEDQVQGTPSFIINGRAYSNSEFSRDYVTILDTLIAEAN